MLYPDELRAHAQAQSYHYSAIAARAPLLRPIISSPSGPPVYPLSLRERVGVRGSILATRPCLWSGWRVSRRGAAPAANYILTLRAAGLPPLPPGEGWGEGINPRPSNLATASGRGGGIRTPDILLPKQARYQTALHPVNQAVTPHLPVHKGGDDTQHGQTRQSCPHHLAIPHAS